MQKKPLAIGLLSFVLQWSTHGFAQEIACVISSDKVEQASCINWAEKQGMDVDAWVCGNANEADKALTGKCSSGKIVEAVKLDLRSLKNDKDIADFSELKRIGHCLRDREEVPLWVCTPAKARIEKMQHSQSELDEKEKWLESHQDKDDQKSVVEKAKETYDDLKDKKEKIENLKTKAEDAKKVVEDVKKATARKASAGSSSSSISAPSLPSIPKPPGITAPGVPLPSPGLPGTGGSSMKVKPKAPVVPTPTPGVN